ncbi:hypothetical protein [Buchananella hordeovulneris]|uniref:2'-5' RNA ligase family protein n=1 Tax=Buchananella hordeovulneris TaxID=52770 RepID=A0A1Q5PY23_9ACTO|nr:hypothetical protein [Buchananella hordeovulneris]MDO5081313.1 hypothetical protein [Buchananella hordeovulneris]OKL52335.1 hypothetical protein BSZ40_02300 [Buchananella hordeovulneris]
MSDWRRESLAAFAARIGAFAADSVPHDFAVNPAVAEKVAAETGRFLPFFGNTTAYLLPASAQEYVARLADTLHARHGEHLAAPLPPALAHVTLHDLRASSQLAAVAADVFRDGPALGVAVAAARALGPVRCRLTYVFNLVNTSVVVGLQAVDEAAHRRLLAARDCVSHLVPHPHFTPHLTLAYYRSGPVAPEFPPALAATLRELSLKVRDYEVELLPELLHGLHFSSMATYWPVC